MDAKERCVGVIGGYTQLILKLTATLPSVRLIFFSIVQATW